jgi:FKBP-type peptidyl-prolyl cis-trans isomerase
MKKQWFYLFLSACILGATCISCNDNTEEIEWRDANIAYMSSVAQKPGILTIGDSLNGFSGIYYEVLESGDSTSMMPIIGDVVTVDYSGWLYNSSTPFESSIDFSQQLGRNLIPGWTLALENMHIGDKWKIYLPYYQGYGISSNDNVPSYSALIFTIKLKNITTTR